MKLLSVAIPCYNSEAYMANCIESLLVGGEEVEIIVVNDGSKDRTAEIAEEYASKYPTIVKAINKENGGHGSAVNAGLENATGLYFKVVDSDDWVDADAYKVILAKLEELAGSRPILDMLISNFVYDKAGVKKKKVMKYSSLSLPKDRLFTWDEVGHFFKGQYILMHSVIFRTKMLRECGVVLPEHTFYVDNLFVFEPLPYVKNMYYLDVDFYHYFIGREDQSVNEQVMISRIDQQLFVNKRMMEYMVEKKNLIRNRHMRSYMLNYLDIITTVSSILLIKSGTEENLEKKKELWKFLKKKDRYIFMRLRYGLLGNCMNLPGKGGRKISVEGYKLCQKFFNFN